jgi:putative SOS response-associated peptidase YedK
MAALANVAPATEHKASNGFTIVTADAQGGMVDVHDRRPVILSAADAALWLDPDLSAEQAQHLLNATALSPECFEWYQVDRAVGNVRSQGPKLAAPITP